MKVSGWKLVLLVLAFLVADAVMVLALVWSMK